jgi:hypothetical protein
MNLFIYLFIHLYLTQRRFLAIKNYIASNEMVTGKINWKGFGRKRSWPNFKALSQHFSGGTEENHKKSLSVSWYPG